MREWEKLDRINSFSNVPRISKPRMPLSVHIHCSVLMCTNFPGELEISLPSRALTNRLLELCAGKMGLFSAERRVNLHLNEYFFLEGIFHCRSNKFFSWVNCSNHLTCGLCVPSLCSLITKVQTGKLWPVQRVQLKGQEWRQALHALWAGCLAQVAGLEMTGMTGKAAQHLPESENATAAGEFCIPPQIPQQLEPRRGGGEGGREL